MTTLLKTTKFLLSFRAKVFIIIALVLSFSASVYAQEVLWEKLNGKAKTLFKQKQYPEALSVAEEALKVAEDTFGPDHPEVAITLENMKALYYTKLSSTAKM